MVDLPSKVLVLGSGALKIGEAGEFDYSGSQAIKAFKEEGVHTVLVNPNIATVQTSLDMADRVYLLPVDVRFVTDVIERERPDGIFVSCGGQTALNCSLELEDGGVLDRFGIRVLGTPIESVRIAEDRQRFADRLREIDVATPTSKAVTTLDDAIEVAEAIGYPVMVRAAFALGGMGSGRCADRAELEERVPGALAFSPQVLVEEYLEGWKEIEYEVVRDAYDNAVTVCNMENLDPLGIHTGESIVVAPSQTIDNEEYHELRSVSIRVFRSLGLIGEGNCQFALHPETGNWRVIEVNPRLSRSSALASKATGYPLAYISAKLALGYGLPELRNTVTGSTAACFEPALDYVVVKVPRWDLSKFSHASFDIGTAMKSVGEVMGIGRTFEEALQKALRMLDIGVDGVIDSLPTSETRDEARAPENWAPPTPDRIFSIARAFAAGVSLDDVEQATHIHPWFLNGVRSVVETALGLGQGAVATETLRHAKQQGFSDRQIGILTGVDEGAVRASRFDAGIHPVVKQIDTLAGEYPAATNYLYLTWNGTEDDVEAFPEDDRPVVILGAGPYRIGCSVEFDWCCVEATRGFRRRGIRTVIVNCNPETVSTDYDESDHLYFEELSLETILEVCRLEKPRGVVVSVGGQVSNSLAGPLKAAGVPIIGTNPDDIDRAEDRHVFSALLDTLGIQQPPWTEASDLDAVKTFCAEVGYPVVVRPSYVLSGSAMAIATGPEELEAYLARASGGGFSRGAVVVSRFIEDAKEIELDGVACDGDVVSMTLAEHIENAGVHSGDATIVIPPQRIFTETARRVREAGRCIAKELNITGPFNIQFVARENEVRVIECNLRASRSLPFVSKVTGYPYIEAAVASFLGEAAPPNGVTFQEPSHVGVKAPQFSFSRIRGADPRVGVEMASTGEVGCLGDDFDEAFLKALMSVGYRFPLAAVLLSTGRIQEKVSFLQGAAQLRTIGVRLFATPGSARFLHRHGIDVGEVGWPDTDEGLTAADLIIDRKVDLVVNIPKNNLYDEMSNDLRIRTLTVEYNLPLVTNIQLASRLAAALARPDVTFAIKSLGEYTGGGDRE